MTRKSKLEEHGLLDEAKELQKTGMGLHEIANHIMQKHPEVELSFMAVKRGLAVGDQKKIDEQIQEGLNPADVFIEEFRKQVDVNTEKLSNLEKKANKILDEAMESDSISDKAKALKEVRDTLGQIVKNYTALQQYCVRQTDGINRKAFEQKAQVNNLLMIWINTVTEGVCPRCKETLIPKLIKLVESENKLEEKD